MGVLSGIQGEGSSIDATTGEKSAEQKAKDAAAQEAALKKHATTAVEEFEEAAVEAQKCAKKLLAAQKEIKAILDELWEANKAYVNISFKSSAESIKAAIGGNPLSWEEALAANQKSFEASIWSTSLRKAGGAWPFDGGTAEEYAGTWRMSPGDASAMPLPDYPELDREKHAENYVNLYYPSREMFPGYQLTSEEWGLFPSGWGSLFSLILAQASTVVDGHHMLNDTIVNKLTTTQVTHRDENPEADAGLGGVDYYNVLTSMNHSIIETVENYQGILGVGGDQGSVVVTDKIGKKTDDNPSGDVNPNSIYDILKWGGAKFFPAGNRNEKLSPISLLSFLSKAGTNLTKLGGSLTTAGTSHPLNQKAKDLGSHLISIASRLGDKLTIARVQSECIFKVDSKYRQAMRAATQALIDELPGGGILGTVGKFFGIDMDPRVLDEALKHVEFDDVSKLAATAGLTLFASEAIFREQCWLLSYVDLLANFKKSHLDTSGTPTSKRLPYVPGGTQSAKANATLLLDGDPYGFINRLTIDPKTAYLFDMTNAEMANLQPRIRLYKVTYDEKGETLGEVEINFDSCFNQQRYGLPDVLKDRTKRGSGVGLKSFNFTYEGTNMFSIKKSISANLKIFANDIKELFESRGDSSQPWKYADLALKTGNIKKNQANNCFDPLEENVDNYPLNFRLRAEIGLAQPSTSISSVSQNPGAMMDALRSSYVTLNLTPTVHDFEFDEMGRVVFNVTYLAYIEEMFDQSAFNIFAGAKVHVGDSKNTLVALKRMERELKIKSFKKKCQEDNVSNLKKEMEAEIVAETAASLQWLIQSMMGSGKIKYIGLTHAEISTFIKDGPYEGYLSIKDKLAAQIAAEQGNTSVSTKSTAGSSPFISTSNPYNSSLQTTMDTALQEFKTQGATTDPSQNAIKRALMAGAGTKDPVISYFYISDLLDQILENLEMELTSLPKVLAGLDNIDTDERNRRMYQVKQYQKSYRKLRILLGPAELSTPRYSTSAPQDNGKGSGSTIININLGDIPISVKYFMDWITDKMLKKREVDYPLTKFMNDLFNDLLYNFLNNTKCFGYSIKQKALLQQASITAYSPGDNNSNDTITRTIQQKGQSRGIVGGPNQTGVITFPMGSQILDLSGPGGSARVSIPIQNETNYFVYFVGRVQPTELMQGKRKNKKDESGAVVIGDESRGIFHYLLGRDKGIIKNIKLSKTQSPGLAEVRFEQQGYDGLTQLRVIYDVQIDTFANVNTFPGTYIYVDPRGFSPGGHVLPDTDNVDLTDLGIGGYYMIYKSSHAFGEGHANTSISAQWVNAIENSEKTKQCQILKERSAGIADRGLPKCSVEGVGG